MGRSERLFDSLARTKGSTDEQFFNLIWNIGYAPAARVQFFNLIRFSGLCARNRCAVFQFNSKYWICACHPCTVFQLKSIFWTLRSRFTEKEGAFSFLRQPLRHQRDVFFDQSELDRSRENFSVSFSCQSDRGASLPRKKRRIFGSCSKRKPPIRLRFS